MACHKTKTSIPESVNSNWHVWFTNKIRNLEIWSGEILVSHVTWRQLKKKLEINTYIFDERKKRFARLKTINTGQTRKRWENHDDVLFGVIRDTAIICCKSDTWYLHICVTQTKWKGLIWSLYFVPTANFSTSSTPVMTPGIHFSRDKWTIWTIIYVNCRWEI